MFSPTLTRLLQAHRWLIALVGAGIVLRILIPIEYGPAFYFSDTKAYFEYAELMRPSEIRPYGYSALLNLVQPTGSIWPLIILNNVMGLACGVIIYALIIRKGGPKWLAVLAAAPIVLDAYALVVEHYLLADTLFTFLLIIGFAALVWEEKLSVRYGIIGGVFFAGALLTRTVGVPLVILIGLYLLIRRVGWRSFTAVVLAAGVPLIGYLLWFHHFNGVYSFSTWQDRWMYGRVMSIADCPHLKLSANEKPLCKRNPDYAYDVNYYVWSPNSPVAGVKRKTIYLFVGEVIKQQPADFTKLVAKESWAHFSPSFYLNRTEPRGTTCPGTWEFTDTISEPGCTPRPVANSRWGDHKGEVPQSWTSPLAGFFDSYSKWGVTPGPVLFGCLLLVIATFVAPTIRRRRSGISIDPNSRLRWDAVLFGTSGSALIVVAVATSQFDIRYGIPALALIPVAGALAWIQLRATLTAKPKQQLDLPPVENERVLSHH